MGELGSLSATRILGRYALYDEIAAGGMATVHLGRLIGPVGFSRTVAIKRLHAQYAKDPEFVAMFLDEGRLAARIRHPNVVPTLDVVALDKELFLVMEYVQGESLSRLFRAAANKGAPIPRNIAVTVMAGVLHGLHAAHEAKTEQGSALAIVHRDVSPQNVLVGIDGVARVLDFGVAKATERMQTTQDGRIKGKISYMAPEQLMSDAVDRRADVYAAAVVLWELLAGKRLFEGSNDARVLAKVLGEPPQPPSSVEPSVPKDVDRIVMRGLSRDRALRFQTAREMAVALENVGALAPASAIGEWVESIAHDALVKRASRVSEIESRSDIHAAIVPAPPVSGPVPRSHAGAEESAAPASGTSPSQAPTSVSSRRIAPTLPEEMVSVDAEPPEPAPVPKRRGRVVLGLAVAVAAVGAIAFFARGRATTATATTSTIATTTTTTTPTPSPTATAEPVTIATTTSKKPMAHPPAKAPSPAARPPKTPADSCDPPYTIDTDGIRHAKPECLK